MIRKDRIEENDIEGILEKGFTDWDAQRLDGLNDLLAFGVSKTQSDERNFARLRRKHGEAHPLTRQARASADAGRIMVAELKREVIRTETPQPAANAAAWTIHGYVFNVRNETVADVPVVLFDAEGGQIERSAAARTGANGYFRLQVANVKNLPPSVRVGVPPDFTSDAVFTPETGETDYAEIIVTGTIKEEPCEPTEPPSPDDRIPTGVNFSDWLVTGQVIDARGEGIANLKVRVFDKDLIDDDVLGETETNADGVYRLKFTKEQFTDFGENYPELYLIIEDAQGRKLFDGKREAKGKAGRIELIDVQLKQYASGKTGRLNREKQ